MARIERTAILEEAGGEAGRLPRAFYGASSMERLPAEIALTEQTRKFMGLKGRKNAAD